MVIPKQACLPVQTWIDSQTKKIEKKRVTA